MEKTVEFLVENAARHESQIQAIRKLIQAGMKMIVSSQAETNRKFDVLIDAQLRTESGLSRTNEALARTNESLARTNETVARLAEAQAATEIKLQALIDSQKNPRNGHNN